MIVTNVGSIIFYEIVDIWYLAVDNPSYHVYQEGLKLEKGGILATNAVTGGAGVNLEEKD